MSMIELKAAPRREVDDALLNEIVAKIVAHFRPHRIILFGSRAKGKQHCESDLDLFVEMESTLPKWKRRIAIDELFGLRDWAMDLVVLTPAEVERQRGRLTGIVPEVEREGIVLYERL